MIPAFLYLLGHSWRNRLLARLRRLKQPKYLVGALMVVAYLYFYMYRLVLNPHNFSPGGSWISQPENRQLLESVAALVLGLIMLLSWVVPSERAALIFSEAEVAFLFPAPVSRRMLVHFKLLKSQLGILITALIFTLIFRHSLTGGPGWVRGVGWWVIFSTLNLHRMGASFVRTRLLDRGMTAWKRRALVLSAVALAALAVGWWAVKTLPPLDPDSLHGLSDVLNFARGVFESGPLPWLLYPFRLVVRPYLAADAPALLAALGPALLLLAANYWWVVRSDVAFEEASVEASRKMAERVANIRANRGRMTAAPKKKKRAPFKLRPGGWPAVGLLWKNLIGAGQAFTWRLWFLFVWIAIVVGFSAGANPHGANVAAILGSMAVMLLLMSFLIGPQLVRSDFRQDLRMADVLKSYPLKARVVALGELLAPATILTAFQWLLVVLCVALSANFGGREMGFAFRLALAAAIAVIAPGLNLVSLLVPNAAALYFPGWFHSGREGPQGIEVMGQRLIFALGQFVVLAVALLPAALAFTLVFFVSRLGLGSVGAIPLGAVAAAAVLAGEAALGIAWLGRLFERLDLSVEQTT